MEDLHCTVYDKLIRFRAENNITQKEFAKMSNLSSQTISNFERMRDVKNPVTLYKILLSIEKYEKKEN